MSEARPAPGRAFVFLEPCGFLPDRLDGERRSAGFFNLRIDAVNGSLGRAFVVYGRRIWQDLMAPVEPLG